MRQDYNRLDLKLNKTEKGRKKITLVILFSINFILSAQNERYFHKYNERFFHGIRLIKLYENNRFEIVRDERCYKSLEESGIFKRNNDSIILNFYKIIDSKYKIIEENNKNETVNVSIKVLSLKDSSIIRNATIFCRDTTRQQFDLFEKVDSTGQFSFSTGIGKTIKYLRVEADNYRDCIIYFAEKYRLNYFIEIYLSEDPLFNKDYSDPTYKQEVVIIKNKKKIKFRGVIFKKLKG